ncbi:unnamed protein product [Rhizophagus irregularis]|nr:unnamed protein product [Rhizophagus irregularis]
MSSIITDNLSSTFHSPISWSIYTESPESSPTNNKFPSYSPIQYSSEEEIDVDYSCPKCRNPRINDRWCKHCESKRLSEDFQNWTSNNEILDEFIRDTQRNAAKKQDYLVWIDFNKFEDVTYLARGGFSDVHYAVWVEGPERKLVHDKDGKWNVQAKTPVALKCLHNSENLTIEFLNELKAHYKCRNGSVLRCYGITYNKNTKNYMLVMKYANGGDLRHYLSHNDSILTWGQKLLMLKEIALAIKICEGLRPKIGKKRVPRWYIGLMIECWNKDPLRRPDIIEVRKIIANNYLNEKHGITNLPYKVRKVKRLSQITSHPEAVFTSRLLNYSNLPQPLDAPDISEYSSYYSSSDEEQDEEENKIEENEENEESNYVTRAFDETLSFGGVPKVSSKKQISSEPSDV